MKPMTSPGAPSLEVQIVSGKKWQQDYFLELKPVYTEWYLKLWIIPLTQIGALCKQIAKKISAKENQ